MIWLRDTSGTWPSRGLKIEWPMQEELTRGLVRALSTNHFHPCQSFDIGQWVNSDSTGIFKSRFSVFSSLLSYPVFPFPLPQYLVNQILLSWKQMHFQCAVSLQIASGKKDTKRNFCFLLGLVLFASAFSYVAQMCSERCWGNVFGPIGTCLNWVSSLWRGWDGG